VTTQLQFVVVVLLLLLLHGYMFRPEVVLSSDQ